jgi:hypothetical protein
MIHVRRHIDSDSLRLPELRQFIGKDVEIIVIEQSSAGTSIGGRRDLTALSAIAGRDLIEPDAYVESRRASMV